jgi:hypothetical protein
LFRRWSVHWKNKVLNEERQSYKRDISIGGDHAAAGVLFAWKLARDNNEKEVKMTFSRNNKARNMRYYSCCRELLICLCMVYVSLLTHAECVHPSLIILSSSSSSSSFSRFFFS